MDPRNTIFTRVRTPGPSQDRRLCASLKTTNDDGSVFGAAH